MTLKDEQINLEITRLIINRMMCYRKMILRADWSDPVSDMIENSKMFVKEQVPENNKIRDNVSYRTI